MPTPNALVVLAMGAEEMEVAIVVDVLRRAGVHTVVAGLDGIGPVTCSRGMVIMPDLDLAAVQQEFDALILPGGTEGADRLANASDLGERLGFQLSSGGILAAICAAPIALKRHEVALGRRITSHPSVKARLERCYQWCDERVSEDGQLITSQGPGTSFEFALTLVRKLCGEDKHNEIRGPLLLPTE